MDYLDYLGEKVLVNGLQIKYHKDTVNLREKTLVIGHQFTNVFLLPTFLVQYYIIVLFLRLHFV